MKRTPVHIEHRLKERAVIEDRIAAYHEYGCCCGKELVPQKLEREKIDEKHEQEYPDGVVERVERDDVYRVLKTQKTEGADEDCLVHRKIVVEVALLAFAHERIPERMSFKDF